METDWMVRCREEYEELALRIDKLGDKLMEYVSEDDGCDIDQVDYYFLSRQFDAMCSYLSALSMRCLYHGYNVEAAAEAHNG